MPARRTFAVLLGVALVALTVFAAAPRGYAATPSWPPSSDLMLAEVVTGGASASDEYVEIVNGGPTSVDLGGSELVYVTASGATTTRKASFAPPLPLAPGQHLLVANAGGAFAALADATYTNGLSADGGTLVLRRSGATLDAVGWGTASNASVEGAPASAPPAGSSIERRPGGELGNYEDTNDNATDWVVQPEPIPQPLGAPPIPPGPTATPTAATSPPEQTPNPTAEPTITPAPTAEPTITPAPTSEPSPSAEPTPSQTPESTATPSAGPTAEPTATPPPTPETTATPEPTAEPTITPEPSVTAVPTPAPTATPEPSSVPVPIAQARGLPAGLGVLVEGVLTIRLGVLEDGRAGFVQDSSGAIGLWLDAAPAEQVAAGTVVRVRGVVDERYGQKTIRVAADGVSALGCAVLPEPLVIATAAASELQESVRVAARGVVTEAPDALADGTGLWIDDGSGPLRVVVTADAAAGLTLARGLAVLATGPLGQRSSATSPGYRLIAAEPGSVVVFEPEPDPTPTVTATASATVEATPTSSGTPDPSSTPSGATPTPTGGPSASPSQGQATPIAAARALPPGTVVRVAGVVTAPPGTPGAAVLLAIEDATAGLFVRLPASVDGIVLGRWIEVAGTLAAPYGQLELRKSDQLVLGAVGPAPSPRALDLAQLGEPLEGSLVTIDGTVEAISTETDGRLTLTIGDGQDSVRAYAVSSIGLTRSDVARGDSVRVTGVLGQRASKTGAADGYRLWLRARSDLVLLRDGSAAPSGPAPTASSGSSGASARPSPSPFHDLVAAIRAPGSVVEVDAVVTAAVGLFEWGGPTLVADDGTAAVAVVLPAGAPHFAAGARIHLHGKAGSWHSGPRVVATLVQALNESQAVAPLALSGQPEASLEWRLVRASGRIEKVTRVGSRWSADMLVGGQPVSVLGEPAAGIPAATMVKGRLAVVTGIVRRSPSDKARFQLLPRSTGDVRVEGAPAAAAKGAGAAAASVSKLPPGTVRADIAGLTALVGRTVTLSGLVVEVAEVSATIEDGTGRVRLRAAGDDPAAISLLEVGDAVEVTGMVRRDGADIEVVADPSLVVELSGDLTAEGTSGPSIAALVGPLAATPRGGAAAMLAKSSPGSSALLLPLGLLLALLLVGLATLAAAARAKGIPLAELVARPGSFLAAIRPRRPLAVPARPMACGRRDEVAEPRGWLDAG